MEERKCYSENDKADRATWGWGGVVVFIPFGSYSSWTTGGGKRDSHIKSCQSARICVCVCVRVCVRACVCVCVN